MTYGWISSIGGGIVAEPTEAQKQDNPGHKGVPMDETLKSAIMDEALSLRMSGDPDLEAKGLVLQVAAARGDIKAVRKVMGDLHKMAKEADAESQAEAYGYLRDSLPEESEADA